MRKNKMGRIASRYLADHDNPAVYTDGEIRSLRRLIEKRTKQAETAKQCEKLADSLETGVVVSSKRVSCDVVTLNSKVQIRDEIADKPLTFTLVCDDKADVGSQKVPVLSSLGIAVLGRKVGDQVGFDTSSGFKRVRVERLIYQPEALKV